MPTTTERMFDLVAGHILGLSAFLTLLIAIFAPKGLAVLFGLTALPFILAGLTGKRIDGPWTGPSMRLAAAFVILSLASALWSMTPEVSMKKALVFALVLFGGVILTLAACRLDGAAKRAFDTGLIAGGVLGFGVIAIEVVFDSPLYSILWRVKGYPPEIPVVLLRALNQGAAVAAIFLLPWTMAVKRRKGALWAGAGFAVGITVLAFCQADSHKAALAVGLLAALAAFVGGRPVLRGFSFLLVAGVLTAPWAVSVLPDPLQPNNSTILLPNSSQHRLAIWQTTARHIFERPLFGSGFDTTRAFYGEDQKVKRYFGGQGTHTTWTNRLEPIPLHSHNGALQVWLELGVAGALLLAAGLFLVVCRLAGVEDRFKRAMVFGSFVTGLTIFSVSYGAWQGWWMGAIWLLMAFGATTLEEKT